jgi:hypothetical protein
MRRLGLCATAALGLASCGYSTYYPHPVGDIVDTGSSQVQIPCGSAGATEVSLTVFSSIAETWYLYEVDPTSCVEAFRAELPSGGSVRFPTLGGVTWVSRGADGALIAFFGVPDGVADHTEYVP